MNAKELDIAGPDAAIDNTAPTEDVRAWEEIAAGRYMPRRIRGSLRGRVLG